MRLFVAVQLPAVAVSHLNGAVTAVRGSLAVGPALRWVRPDAWHLTLAFLGEVGSSPPDELDARLARAAGRRDAFALTVCGAGRFDGRILWAGLASEVLALRRLADGVRAAARRSGIDVEDRPYRPHLTLARAREPLDLRPYVEQLSAYEGPPWPVTAVALVRSHLGEGPDGGSRYEVLTEHPLRSR